MTATPIPRTLALTLYGDLDVSVIDEMPPGRTPIITRCVSDERSAEVWDFVRKQVAARHQVYVVYPVIEENEETELKAAMKMYKELSKRIFPDLRVAVLHGRMEPDLKEQVMRLFQKGEVDILVSTTVIEVGVDVANATMMIIEHAERFGLAQLHQLARSHWPRCCEVILRPDDRRQNFRRRRTPPRRHGAHQRRISDCGT